ncbi:MAG: hypothetical protein K2J16_03060, partial [Clostridia bacterium]|nr:hypothetical protein [Clostridia bacterium]
MSQDRQLKKVKQYRTLKIVFYCLGFPLFFAAVFLAAIKFIGNDPFTGTSDFTTQLGFFHSMEILFTSPALFGVYLAFGVWMLITIIHAILGKAIKSRRTRALSVVALCLVVMLGGMFAMDGVLSAKVNEISESAPSGVTVADYKTQLSYYRTISSKISQDKNMTAVLNQTTELLEKVYNVGMEGVEREGTAGNIGNKPVTYGNIISDDGIEGVDISFVRDEKTGFPKLACDNSEGKNMMTGDGKKENDKAQLVRLAPNSNGELVINGKVYSHYFYVYKTMSSTKEAIYEWYAKDLMPTSWQWNLNKSDPSKTSASYHPTDGIYGKGMYNNSGLLADGWVYSIENVVEILEDYYLAKNAIENGDEYATAEQYAEYYSEMFQNALQARKDYYEGRTLDENGNPACDPWLSALYKQEERNEERFSLTRSELEDLLAKVADLLGDNSLFDYLLKNIDTVLGSDGLAIDGILSSFLSTTLGKLFTQLNEGMSLRNLLGMFIKDNLDGTMDTVIDYVKTVANRVDEDINDIYITAAYKAKDAFGREQDHLYIALFTDDGNGGMGTDPEKNILIEIDLDYNLIDPVTGAYTFDFDAVSEFLNVGLNNLLDKFGIDISGGIINTVLGLFLKDMDFNGVSYKGLNISGIKIPLINNTTGKLHLDINGILMNLIKGFYSYQSSAIKPIWEFYESEIEFDQITYDNRTGKPIDGYKWAAAKHFASFERAEYLATVQGTMMGSTLIGDNLGTGAYPSSFGLTDLQSVQQYKTDMSYQRLFFPLYSLRDMLALFAGLVMIFYFLSFVAAQKEEDYATGNVVALTRKEKKQLMLEEAMLADEIALDESENIAVENVASDEQQLNEQPADEQLAEEEIKTESENTESLAEEGDSESENADESHAEESVAENEESHEEESLVQDELNAAEENDSVEVAEILPEDDIVVDATDDFVEETPVEENPVEETAVEETPVEEAPVEEEDNRIEDEYIDESDLASLENVANEGEQATEETPLETEEPVMDELTEEPTSEELPAEETVEEEQFTEEPAQENVEFPVENAEFNEMSEFTETLPEFVEEESKVEEMSLEEQLVEESAENVDEHTSEEPVAEEPVTEEAVSEESTNEVAEEPVQVNEQKSGKKKKGKKKKGKGNNNAKTEAPVQEELPSEQPVEDEAVLTEDVAEQHDEQPVEEQFNEQLVEET